MTNGSNNFGVSFSQISWIEKALRNHPNVVSVARLHDIQFDISRNLGDELLLVCLNEYTCGLARVYDALDQFSGTNIIYVGGNWNNYTQEAKDFCLLSNLGLYNSSEINGALQRGDFWNYHRKDENRNPIYPTRAV
jgi:hypothetical protein